jgi:hypothetical protein
VLSPSTTANAGLSTSLMNSTSSTTGGYPVAKDTSGGVTNGMYYVTTDAFGIFDLTGDYTCTVNQPVYITAVGGSPTFPNTTGAVGITGVTEVSTTGTGAAQTGTLTFTSASTELFYPGELVTLTGFTGDLAYLNNSVQTVLPNNLTTTQFEATLGTWNGTKDINAAYTGLSGRAAATPPQNPAAVNMAALGLCPPSGNFAGTISFIYMNEISTVSLAYATAAFGSDAFHIGIKAGGPLDLAGPNGGTGYVTGSLGQAFNNANLLYDITGGNVSTTYAGEGHIARPTTPAGNGTVPQNLLDSLGNILASCVDSANSSSTTSPACSALFSTATLDGKTTGTKPTDIAAAAFNIAHYPAGTSNTSFVSTIFNLPTGNVPFVPDMATAPNDFTVGIQFAVNSSYGSTSTNLISNPQVISLDGQPTVGTEYNNINPENAVWIGSYGGQPLKLFTNGTPDYATNSAGLASSTRARSVTIDDTGNVWILNESTGNLQKFSDTGTLLTTIAAPTNPFTTNGFYNGVFVALDSIGNVYADYEDSTEKLTSAGINIPYLGGAVGAIWSTLNTTIEGASAHSNTVYLDSTGLVYAIGGNTSTGNTLCVADPALGTCKATVTGFTANTASNAVTFSAIDGSNTFWSTNVDSNNVVGYNYASNPGAINYTCTGAGLNQPDATAIDGSGNIWVANGGNASFSLFTPTCGALSTTNGLGTMGFSSSNSSDLAIDRAGDIWAVFSGKNYIYEFIGLATPAVASTAYATFNHLIGTRPY